MPVTNYYTVQGEIIGEHTAGQSRLDYLTDGLGSVIATVDQTLTVKSTARYKPYGADLETTATQPAFGCVGKPGFRRTGRPHAYLYQCNCVSPNLWNYYSRINWGSPCALHPLDRHVNSEYGCGPKTGSKGESGPPPR